MLALPDAPDAVLAFAALAIGRIGFEATRKEGALYHRRHPSNMPRRRKFRTRIARADISDRAIESTAN
jgi:hypothetical protein